MKTFENLVFEGCYADLCLRFIEYKRNLGYNYGLRRCYSVKYLNDYLAINGSDANILTKELVEGYIAKKKGESTSSQSKKTFLVRQFAHFLSSLGYDAYQPPIGRIKVEKTFVPYIYTKEQISAIIQVSEKLRHVHQAPNSYLVFPMLLRLLFGCGLRISEALNLTFSDVNLEEGILTIKQAKFNNSRLVPMSRGVWDYCRKYCERVNFMLCYSGHLFPSRRGGIYKQNSVYHRFRSFLKDAGIPHGGRGNGPRLHDARHTYAVYALEQMVKQGMDMYCALPILSTYMGHRTVESTEKYVRLVPSEHAGIIDTMAPSYNGLFPEVTDYE